MANLKRQFYGSDALQIGIATVGIIAGSIVVPALAAKEAVAKSTVAAWGGVSGAANAGQMLLNQQGASAPGASTVYETVRSEISKASAQYSKPNATDQEKSAAVNTISMICKYPPLPKVTATSGNS